MCVNAYEKLSDRTGKTMIFCKLLGNDGAMSQLCTSQRYCNEKDRYVPNDPKIYCKNYKD